MRATIDIDPELVTKVETFALQKKCTFQALVTEGLHRVLEIRPRKKNHPSLQLTVSSATGGLCKGVDLCSNAAVRDLMDFS